MNLNIQYFQLFIIFVLLISNIKLPRSQQIMEEKRKMGLNSSKANTKVNQDQCDDCDLSASMPDQQKKILQHQHHVKEINGSGFQLHFPLEQVNSNHQLSFPNFREQNDEENSNKKSRENQLYCRPSQGQSVENGGFQTYLKKSLFDPSQSFQKQIIHGKIFHQIQSNNQSDKDKLKIKKIDKKSIKNKTKRISKKQKSYPYKRISRASKKRNWRRIDSILLAVFLKLHTKGIQQGIITIGRLCEYSKTTDRLSAHQNYTNFFRRNKSLTYEEKIQKIKRRCNVSQAEFNMELEKMTKYEEDRKKIEQIQPNKQSKFDEMRKLSIVERYKPQMINSPFGKFKDQIKIVDTALEIISSKMLSQGQQKNCNPVQQYEEISRFYHTNVVIRCKFSLNENDLNLLKNGVMPQQIALKDIKSCLLDIAFNENDIIEQIMLNSTQKPNTNQQKQDRKIDNQGIQEEKSVSNPSEVPSQTEPVIKSVAYWRHEEKVRFIGFISYFEQALEELYKSRLPLQKFIQLLSDYIKTKNHGQCKNIYLTYRRKNKSVRGLIKDYMEANGLSEKDLQGQAETIEGFFSRIMNKFFVISQKGRKFTIDSPNEEKVLNTIRQVFLDDVLQFVPI